jgi:hypothetical protein
MGCDIEELGDDNKIIERIQIRIVFKSIYN